MDFDKLWAILAACLAVVVFCVLLPGLVGRLFMGMRRSARRGGSSSGGFAGSFSVIDRITRPSIEHVEKVDDESTDEDDSGSPPQ